MVGPMYLSGMLILDTISYIYPHNTLFSSSKTSLNSLFLILVAMAAIFSKLLTKSDIVHKKLDVPASALPYFMGILQERHYADLRVIDWTGQVWSFRIYTRPDGIHRKPVLTKGWLPFVKARGLGEGDEVSFFENQDGDGGLQCKVHRPLQCFSLSGEPIIRDGDFNEGASIALPDPAAPAPFHHFI